MGDDLSAGLVERRFSKDLTRKATQVVDDARRTPLRDAEGNVVTVRQGGRTVPVLKARAGERDRAANRRGDVLASRANSMERMVREEASAENVLPRGRGRGDVPRVRGRKARDIVAMVMEGTITSAKHFERDLRAHRDRLREEISKPQQYRHHGELEAAQNRPKLVEGVLASPRALRHGQQVVRAGEEVARRHNQDLAANVKAGIMSPEAASRARLIPAAIEHMGARHFTVQEHARLEKAAQKRERAARVAVAAQDTPANRAALRAAREERIAVSGRDPRRVEAHEARRAAARQARARGRTRPPRPTTAWCASKPRTGAVPGPSAAVRPVRCVCTRSAIGPSTRSRRRRRTRASTAARSGCWRCRSVRPTGRASRRG